MCRSPSGLGLAAMTNTPMNIHKFFGECVFNFLEFIPLRVITVSYDKSMFNFQRNCQTAFHRGCCILHSQRLALYIIIIIVIVAMLASVKCYFTEVFIFSSLMTSNI